MCEAEARINRTSAPQLYRGVVAVTRAADGRLALGGTGVPVDWVIEMARFDQGGLFDRLAARGALGLDLMPRLAVAIARFHSTAEVRRDHGGARGMAWVIDGNAASFAEEGGGILDPGACDDLVKRSRDQRSDHASLLDARRDQGFVRQCHGDLHLRNIVLAGGTPTLFDAVEFNDEISCTDVLYDLAFLLMDLWRRRLPWHANAVWNEYLARTDDLSGVALMPLFLSCRAAVRAKTSVTAARLQADDARRRELCGTAGEYLTMARRLLTPPAPCLVAVGGLSGSGKSTLAMRVAPLLGAVPGAVVIRSDVVRKRLCGVDPLERLGPAGYTPEISRRVYADVAARATQVVAAGHAAIVDAVYARPSDRDAIERAAAAVRVPCVGLWLDAPEPVLVARAERRGPDASDADAPVVRRQFEQDLGALAWHRLDAAQAPEALARAAAALLQTRLGADLVRAEAGSV
jgi:aminoglycoside phosphotransferase family enzyme/predicted kinase